ncbi:MAG: DUF1648 domain-containing protein, partial [Propionibacteriaceae bacterium]|nr:DUF1648 domain-containing protein [Propionibacteriaceae bacterium]
MRAAKVVFGLWVLAAAAFVGLWVWGLLTMPAEVPVHTDLVGNTTRWGSRWELLIVLGIAAVVAGGLPVLIGGWIARGGALTHVNIPNKDWWLATPAREGEARRRVAAARVGVYRVRRASRPRRW